MGPRRSVGATCSAPKRLPWPPCGTPAHRAAEASVFSKGNFTFLEVQRFDRKGVRGRRPSLSLAVLMDHYIGARAAHWTESADHLLAARLISNKDAKNIRLLDAFGRCILDTDRHSHNIAFAPTKTTAGRPTFSLAPAYDKLPMGLSPTAGNAEPFPVFRLPIPLASQMEVWEEAKTMAEDFWRRVKKEKTLSASLRDYAGKAQKTLKES